MKLNLGVLDVAYTGTGKPTTTLEVAKRLEDRYHVMEVFYELHKQEILEDVTRTIAATLATGRPFRARKSMHKIDTLFRQYIDAREWMSASGMALAAAESGQSNRFKRPSSMFVKPGDAGKRRSSNPQAPLRSARPEFVDTGLYQQSFRAELKA